MILTLDIADSLVKFNSAYPNKKTEKQNLGPLKGGSQTI